MSYNNALQIIYNASAREWSYGSQLGVAAETLIEAFASSFNAPPERVAIADPERPTVLQFQFKVAVSFFVNEQLKHTSEVPVFLELTRHGLSGSVADGKTHALGDATNPNWSFMVHELNNAVLADCEARQEKSAL